MDVYSPGILAAIHHEAENIDEAWAKERIDSMLRSDDPERFRQCSIFIANLMASQHIAYQNACRLRDYVRSSSAPHR